MDKSDNITYEDYKHTELYKENDLHIKKGLDHLYGEILEVIFVIFLGVNVAVFLISFFL